VGGKLEGQRNHGTQGAVKRNGCGKKNEIRKQVEGEKGNRETAPGYYGGRLSKNTRNRRTPRAVCKTAVDVKYEKPKQRNTA